MTAPPDEVAAPCSDRGGETSSSRRPSTPASPGRFALAWGNDRFPRPALPFDSFVAGVTLHDRGYGQLDVDPVGGEMPVERWAELQLLGAAPRGADPVVDLVAALHVHRLIGDGREPVLAAARARIGALLPGLREAAGVGEAQALEADRVTDLCDRAAFVFCFERPADGAVDVAGGRVAYAVDGAGLVELSPWPLAVPAVDGLILGYEADGYPGELEPVVVPFAVRPG
jgi:hypothetical protein